MVILPLSSDDIIVIAKQVGLDDVAIVAPCRLNEDARFMDDWVSRGLHGQMTYLERNREKRYDPRELVDDCRTMVIGLLTYEHSGHDYHRAVKSKLYDLYGKLAEYHPELLDGKQRIFCDSAPVLERRWAEIAGLGTIAKNHQLVHRTLGSWVHIGELMLPLALAERKADGAIHQLPCSSCSLCEDACPGKALSGEWNATRCVAYVTHKCIVCQQVCPLNNHVI